MTVSTSARPRADVAAGHRLGLGQGTALLTGAVLGPGILALPHAAASAAGPAALAAWALLLALSVPVAFTFAALGARFPDGGGVAAFAARAFGPRTSAAVGWLFLAVVPVGTLAGAMIGGGYVANAAGWGRPGAAVMTVVLLAAAFAANHGGLRMSGRVQLVLVAGLAVLLGVAVLASAPHADAAHFTPFAPYGIGGVVHAIGVLFFAFAGWEAASHLSADFADPRRLLPRATGLALALVGTLYLALAAAVTGVLGERAETSPVPLALLMETGLGDLARAATAVAAMVLSFVAMNTYIAGGSRLGAALARDGALPAWFGRGGPVPHRGLLLLEALAVPLAVAVTVTEFGLDPLLRATAACLASVTVVGMASATRLLTGRARAAARVTTAFTAVAALSCGPYLVIPVAVAAVAALRGRLTSSKVEDLR
ncbi:APC family permease [Actinomadura kijaniata]|uniref:APC family permease n=1 Tax=Actinomadura kijaniata TaxID=46161 RepID=UPI00082F86E2|nr:amino acid permease [Actinomadura kijaniata]